MVQPTFDPTKFRIVMPSTRVVPSTAELRIVAERLEFSFAMAAELGYARQVVMLISEDGTKLIVQPCEEGEQSIPFYREEERRTKNNSFSRKSVPVRHKSLVNIIRSKMGWKSGTYVVAGIRYDNNVVLFDMERGTKMEKGRRIARLSPEEILNTYPPYSTAVKSYRAVPLLPEKGGHPAA